MLVDDRRMRSLNTRDGHGRTPLMEAVWWGRVSCVRYLVMVQGVSLETWDAEGRSLEEASRASPLGRDGQVAMLLQVCLEVMVPPKRILQCRNGHLICGDRR